MARISIRRIVRLIFTVGIVTSLVCLFWTSKNSKKQDGGDLTVGEDHVDHVTSKDTDLGPSPRLFPGSSPKVVPPNVSLVLLLSYQRSGSTYISHVFKDPDHVFFIYEPLDPLYSAMYGTQQGWNGPDDIFNHENGTQRVLPKTELDGVIWYLEKILTCRMSELPPSILIHKFWNGFRGSMPLTADYASCVANKTGLGSDWHKQHDICQKHIKKTCGNKLDSKKLQKKPNCYRQLWGELLPENNYTPLSVRYAHGVDKIVRMPKHFKEYFDCFAPFYEATRHCAKEFYDKPCTQYPIRAIKTVRAQMDVVEYFLQNYPTFHIIHSFRDPRGVTNSRWRAKWALSPKSRKDKSRAARTFCNNVWRDHQLKTKILERYPNKSMDILYDNFIKQPTEGLVSVYMFLNKNITENVLSEFRKNEQEKEKYIVRNQRWRKSLTEEDIRIVDMECRDLVGNVTLLQDIRTVQISSNISTIPENL